MLKLVDVESSNIKSVGYDPDTKLLTVHFHSGRVYEYDGVPEEVYNRMVAAESIGKNFNANIKAQYPYKKVA